jgi:hypothetical protein
MVELGEPVSAGEIAALARTTIGNAKQLLRKLVEAGIVCKPEKGRYALVQI